MFTDQKSTLKLGKTKHAISKMRSPTNIYSNSFSTLSSILFIPNTYEQTVTSLKIRIETLKVGVTRDSKGTC